MAVAPVSRKLTSEEYLEFERNAEFRNEYWFGRVFPVVSSNESNSLIFSNLCYEVPRRLEDSAYRVFGGAIKVHVPDCGFACPDMSIAGDDRKFYDEVRDVLLNPVVVIEVMSDATRFVDQTDKWDLYRKLPSLGQYVLVDERSMRVRQYTKIGGGRWSFEALESPHDVLQMPGIGIDLPLSEIYRDIRLVQDAL